MLKTSVRVKLIPIIIITNFDNKVRPRVGGRYLFSFLLFEVVDQLLKYSNKCINFTVAFTTLFFYREPKMNLRTPHNPWSGTCGNFTIVINYQLKAFLL